MNTFAIRAFISSICPTTYLLIFPKTLLLTIARILRKLFSLKYSYHLPKKDTSVLFLDISSPHLGLIQSKFPSHEFVSVEFRETINIPILVIAFFLCVLFRIPLLDSYLVAYILYVSPSIVITKIDNRPSFFV